jgi:uncharacterized membrane protein
MPDKFEQMTRTEMKMLDSAEAKVIDRETAKVEPKSDALVDALSLLDHLEDQKNTLEQRELIEEKARFVERMADNIAQFTGSIVFIALHLLLFGTWILMNLKPLWFGIKPWDPFPFLFLTLAVSLEAIFLSSFILLAQSRQSIRDRTRDEIDFERDRLDLKVDTLAAKTIREATVRISNVEKQLTEISAKLDRHAKGSQKKRR